MYENEKGKVEKATGCIEKNRLKYCGMNVDLTAHGEPTKMRVRGTGIIFISLTFLFCYSSATYFKKETLANEPIYKFWCNLAEFF